MFYDRSQTEAPDSPSSPAGAAPGDACPDGALLAPLSGASGSPEEAGADGIDAIAETGGPTRRVGYEREVIEGVWSYAAIIPGVDPALWRKDEFGDWIHRFSYGRRESKFGWEIFDPGLGRHVQGVYAMRPMQWGSYLRQFEVSL